MDQTHISNTYIRNKGELNSTLVRYGEASAEDVNNTPLMHLYITVDYSKVIPKKLVFWINGMERPRLVLTRGNRYNFNINTPDHPFYLTTGVAAPSEKCCFIYHIDENVPRDFAYMCTLHSGMGGAVLVV